MSKLFKLKEWLTVNEASAYLSAALSEPVSAADIFRLALDKRLTLSVYFVGLVYGRLGNPIPIEDAPRAPGIPVEGHPPYEVLLGLPISSTEVLAFDPETCFFDTGRVFDIPMIGGERLSCEAEYQRLTGGPAVTVTDIRGAFLIYHKRSDTCPMRIAPDDEPDEWYVQLHERVLEHRELQPSTTLPEGAVFVVRTKVLQEFLQSLQETVPEAAKKELASRERVAYLNIIGGLLELVQSPRDGRNSDAAVIRELVENYGEKYGISASNLSRKFPEARRTLLES